MSQLRNIIEAGAAAAALALGVYQLMTHFTPALTASTVGLVVLAAAV